MDESVDQYLATQREIDAAGGPTRVLKGHLAHSLKSLAICVIIFLTLLAGLDFIPRNVEGSMKVQYHGSALALLGIGSALLLQKAKFRKSPFSMAAWAIILMAVVVIPAALLDAVT